jgi:DNA invertase Pin-like site-specific DNA recombinase
MKIGIYCRTSTSDAQQNPNTQLLALLDFVKAQSWEIYHVFIDRVPPGDSSTEQPGRKCWRPPVKGNSISYYYGG